MTVTGSYLQDTLLELRAVEAIVVTYQYEYGCVACEFHEEQLFGSRRPLYQVEVMSMWKARVSQ